VGNEYNRLDVFNRGALI